jgi:hypothetical protein
MIRVVLSSVPTVIGSVIVLSALKSGKKNDRSFVTTFSMRVYAPRITYKN